MSFTTRAHRWIGLVMVAPFLVWTVTGLLFHLKPGWGRAYDMLSERSSGEAAAPAGLGPVSKLELFSTVLGPVYRVERGGEVSLVDARSGETISPLAAGAARAIAVDAVGRSVYRTAYGEPQAVEVGDGEVAIRFSGGPVVTVDRRSARLSQSGADTARIDWLYRVHYLQWTGVKRVDQALAFAGIVATWLLAGLGVVLFRRRGAASRRAASGCSCSRV